MVAALVFTAIIIIARVLWLRRNNSKQQHRQTFNRIIRVPTTTESRVTMRTTTGVTQEKTPNHPPHSTQQPQTRQIKPLWFTPLGTLRLLYESSDGSTSERIVDIKELGHTGYGPSITGRCQKADALRTFRLDRIKEAVDLETGEMVTDVHAHTHAWYEKTTSYSLDHLYKTQYEVLQVLHYIANADGQMRSPEKQILGAACRALSNDDRLTDEQIIRLLKKDMYMPPLQTFKIACGRINKHREQATKSFILDTVEKIAASKQVVGTTEQEAINYLIKRFSQEEK